MTADSPDDDLLVRTRQLDLAYRRLPLSILLSLTVPLLFAWLLQPLFPPWAVARWLVLLWLAAALRGALWL